MNFETCLEQVSKKFKFSCFPSKVGIVVVRDLGNFDILLTLLLKLAALLFVANCRRANRISSASIVARVLSLRNCGWLVEHTFFYFPDEVPGSSRESLLKSWHHVMSLFMLWIVHISRTIGREHQYGTEIAQGTIPSGFPVFWVVVTGSCRNSYGTSPKLWVQKKFVEPRQRTQNTWLLPVDSLGKFCNYRLFNLFRKLGDVLLSHSWIKCVLRLTVPCIFRCFPWNCL